MGMVSEHIFGAQTDISVTPSHETSLQLHLIGPMRLLASDGASIPFIGRRAHALVALLALSPQPVSRLLLMRLLWSHRGRDQQRASLRQEIHRLQTAFAAFGIDVLQITREHLELRQSNVWTDVDEVFRATVDHPAYLTLLTEPMLEGFDTIDPAFGEWLIGERGKLIGHARPIAEEILSRQAMPEQVIAAAARLLAIDPLHEGAWQAKIRACSESSNRICAIQTYQRFRASLAERLGAVPDDETERLIAAIRADDPLPVQRLRASS